MLKREEIYVYPTYRQGDVIHYRLDNGDEGTGIVSGIGAESVSLEKEEGDSTVHTEIKLADVSEIEKLHSISLESVFRVIMADNKDTICLRRSHQCQDESKYEVITWQEVLRKYHIGKSRVIEMIPYYNEEGYEGLLLTVITIPSLLRTTHREYLKTLSLESVFRLTMAYKEDTICLRSSHYQDESKYEVLTWQEVFKKYHLAMSRVIEMVPYYNEEGYEGLLLTVITFPCPPRPVLREH